MSDFDNDSRDGADPGRDGGSRPSLPLERTGDDEQSARRSSRSGDPIPDRAQILSQITRLPGLLALKIISPAEANAMRASWQVLLSEFARDESPGGRAALADDTVTAIHNMHPAVLNLLEPMLTDDQVALISELSAERDPGQP